MTRILGLCVAGFLAALLAGGRAHGQPTRGTQGTVTYYNVKMGIHACSEGPFAHNEWVAAIGTPHYDGGAACGTCLDISRGNASVVVRITDRCPACGTKRVDLSRGAFSKLGPLSKGTLKVHWRPVPCEVLGPVEYLFKKGSNRHWAALRVMNHRLPVKSLEWKKKGKWVRAKRLADNHFVLSAAGRHPVEVRVTATDGQRLVDRLGPVRSGRKVVGSAQFR